MPGQPSPTGSSSSAEEFQTEYPSNSSLDSLGSESCDDPVDTMAVPDAVVTASEPREPPSPPQDTTDGVETSDPFEETGSNLVEDDLGEKWNPSLYTLQLQAPTPVCISNDNQNSCEHYGKEYHGVIDKHRAEKLVGSQNGAYLVRETPKGAKILTFMLDERLYNFRLFFEDGLHYVGDKKFECLEDLVQDGLITLYLQKHNVAQLMEEGRMNTIRKRMSERKLRRQAGRRVRGLKGRAAWTYSRTPSSSSVTSVEVQPALSVGNSPSPFQSRSPSPVPILSENLPSPVHLGTQNVLRSPPRNKSLSPEPLMLERGEGSSHSAPQTPSLPTDLVLVPPTPVDSTSLDFPNRSQRRSTPTLSTETAHHRSTMAVKSLGQRRAISSSAIVRGSQEERRAAIIRTLRSAVQDDNKAESQNRPELKKSNTLGTTSKQTYKTICERSNSCSAAVANTLDRLADYSVKGPSTLSKSSLLAFARHTSGPRSPYTKAHNFNMHSYMSPTWCEICHNYLWGIKQQGMQCKDCGMDIHKQCLPLAIQLQCFPNKAFVKRVYGVDLTTLVKLEGGIVPKIVSECISAVEERCMDSTGIYRVSGHSSEILELKDKYDEGEPVSFSQYDDENIITGALKLYLRELPIPIVTFDAYKSITKATACVTDPEDENVDWLPLINALQLLPKAHYNTLKHLTAHLSRVDGRSDENKMTARNLAVVFAPTLMRSPSDSEDHILIKDLPLQKTFIEYAINYHSVLFKS